MKILWLKTELLHPVDKGGKIRSYNMLKELKRNCHITYLTLDDGTADTNARELATEYCHELVCIPHRRREKFTAGFYLELLLNLISDLPYAIKKYESPAMRDEVAKRVANGSFDVLVCDFLAPAVNLPRTVQTPVVLFQHNVEAAIWKRHYEVQKSRLKKAYLLRQWQKMQRFERDACRRVECVVAVSEADAEMMQRQYGLAKVYEIPTGVDLDFFRPTSAGATRPNSVVFTGSMDWLPNEDAMQFFIKEIMPPVRRAVPDLHLTIVGRSPYRSLVELAQREKNITITGRVEDVRPYMEQASAFIVPIRIGGGTRLKIYEAMAMEKPVISTTVGAEGLPVRDGVDLLLADDPKSFADALIRVLTDVGLASRLGRSAAGLVRQNFSWRRASAIMADVCQTAIRDRIS